MLLGVVLPITACVDKPEGPCHANVDCPGLEACVLGECVADPAKCERSGAVADISTLIPLHTAEIYEMHVHVADDGAVHYCYYGEDIGGAAIAYYGRQTGWDSVVEERLETPSGSPARCGALAITSSGVVAVLSRSPAAVLFRSPAGGFSGPELDGLLSNEALGALASDRTVISLRADELGGVLVGLSLGYQLESQPVYLARATPGAIDVLINGWSESGAATHTGHAPQVWEGASASGISAVLGKVLSFEVVLADRNLSEIDAVEGLHPRVALDASGAARVVHLDHNYGLWIDEIEDGAFVERAFVGEVGLDESGDGQLPWSLAIDSDGRDHLLYEDPTQGAGALVYRVVGAQGEVGDPMIVSSSLAGDLPGMQLYAHGIDICGRATLAVVEDDEQEQATGIRVLEGR
ncbi:MAG: hypothetical protein R6V85_21400 [Polyangia bacterium]